MVNPSMSRSHSDAGSARKLREAVSLPPVSARTRKVIETTGRLPLAEHKYQMSELLVLTIQSNASDLHLRVGEPPMFRVDGRLIRAEGPMVKSEEAFNLIQAFTHEEVIRVVREAGQADFGVAFERHRFRANVFRAGGEWGAVLRRIPDIIPTLEEIAAPEVFYTLARLPRGLVLLTGPTGAGKTTTLAAMINLINNERSDIHVLTLEDPIEFKYPRGRAVITQRELGTDFLTFADGLKAALREDPDVIMVGEMRDPETMEAALLAAETGHLVFSTLHTIGAKDTVDRIISAVPEGHRTNVRSQMGSILRGVITQVLLPNASGDGRATAFEIMVGTPAIGTLIRENKTHQIPSFLQTQSQEGMCTLDQSLASLYADELVTREAAIEHAQDLRQLEGLIQSEDIKRGHR